MTKLFRAVDTASDCVFAADPQLHRNVTLADAQAALNRVRGIRLSVGLLRHLPPLSEVIERGGHALLPTHVLQQAAISMSRDGGMVLASEDEAFALVGVALTYGRATGQIGKHHAADRQLTITLNRDGLTLAAPGPEPMA